MGIACATMFQTQVTGLDADAAVLPLLQRHGVHLATRQDTCADRAPQGRAAFVLIVWAELGW